MVTLQDASGVKDWRKDLLQAVEGLLEHQRGVLANTLSASVMEEGGDSGQVQRLLQDQVRHLWIVLHIQMSGLVGPLRPS